MEKLDDDPTALDPRQLGLISEDFVKVSDTLKEATYQVRARKISARPIVVACRVIQPIGGLIIPASLHDSIFNYFLSFEEEFIQRGLITEEGLPIFEEHYLNPDEYICLFVVEETFTNFVYIPYPDENDSTNMLEELS
jgi:hypothetical protein